MSTDRPNGPCQRTMALDQEFEACALAADALDAIQSAMDANDQDEQVSPSVRRTRRRALGVRWMRAVPMWDAAISDLHAKRRRLANEEAVNQAKMLAGVDVGAVWTTRGRVLKMRERQKVARLASSDPGGENRGQTGKSRLWATGRQVAPLEMSKAELRGGA